jgi:deoxyribonucleoside regulator
MNTRRELLAWVASMYYQDDLTQAEIADRIGTSRSTVSRLLRSARVEGIVSITVSYPWTTAPDVESAVAARYGLRKASILAGSDRPRDETLRGLGVLAARLLNESIDHPCVVGISWGQAVHSTVRALNPDRSVPVKVVQMVGAVGEGNSLIDSPELARLLAAAYHGEFQYLHAPLLVENPSARDLLLREPRIEETLALAHKADIALVGIGAPDPGVYSLFRAGYVDQTVLRELQSAGVAGDICARHYDIQGRILDIGLNHRVIGIPLEALHGIGLVIGVAGGAKKARAILGALRGGHINVLVSDEETARRVLELESLTRDYLDATSKDTSSPT